MKNYKKLVILSMVTIFTNFDNVHAMASGAQSVARATAPIVSRAAASPATSIASRNFVSMTNPWIIQSESYKDMKRHLDEVKQYYDSMPKISDTPSDTPSDKPLSKLTMLFSGTPSSKLTVSESNDPNLQGNMFYMFNKAKIKLEADIKNRELENKKFNQDIAMLKSLLAINKSGKGGLFADREWLERDLRYPDQGTLIERNKLVDYGQKAILYKTPTDNYHSNQGIMPQLASDSIDKYPSASKLKNIQRDKVLYDEAEVKSFNKSGRNLTSKSDGQHIRSFDMDKFAFEMASSVAQNLLNEIKADEAAILENEKKIEDDKIILKKAFNNSNVTFEDMSALISTLTEKPHAEKKDSQVIQLTAKNENVE